MKGIIWYKHREEGLKKLDNIIEQYAHIGIRAIRQSSYPKTIHFDNGDIWRVLPTTDTSRGYKSNISYIERCISIQEINTHIIPSTIAYPYRAFKFYEKGNLKDEWL